MTEQPTDYLDKFFSENDLRNLPEKYIVGGIISTINNDSSVEVNGKTIRTLMFKTPETISESERIEISNIIADLAEQSTIDENLENSGYADEEEVFPIIITASYDFKKLKKDIIREAALIITKHLD
jgi:hypothetical protein